MSSMANGVRIGSNVEEETEAMVLLEVMVIGEREEETNREDAWRPSTLIREQPMPRSPVLPSHLTSTSFRRRLERVRMCQPPS